MVCGSAFRSCLLSDRENAPCYLQPEVGRPKCSELQAREVNVACNHLRAGMSTMQSSRRRKPGYGYHDRKPVHQTDLVGMPRPQTAWETQRCNVGTVLRYMFSLKARKCCEMMHASPDSFNSCSALLNQSQRPTTCANAIFHDQRKLGIFDPNPTLCRSATCVGISGMNVTAGTTSSHMLFFASGT